MQWLDVQHFCACSLWTTFRNHKRQVANFVKSAPTLCLGCRVTAAAAHLLSLDHRLQMQLNVPEVIWQTLRHLVQTWRNPALAPEGDEL